MPTRAFLCLVISLFIVACGGGEPSVSGPSAVRLVDIFASAEVQVGDSASVSTRPRLEWRFDDSSSSAPVARRTTTLGWVAGAGVTGLAIRDRFLVGETTDPLGMLYVRVGDTVGDGDLVHSVEVRGLISEGTNLAVGFLDIESDASSVLRDPCMRLMSTPIRVGEGMQTYTIRVTKAVTVREQRYLLVRPSDAAAAHFELESVRIITLKEHLAEASAAIGWHGLLETYMESIATLAPVAVRFEVALPQQPWLDLVIGTIEEGPVTFRISVSPTAQRQSEEKILLEREITGSAGWQEADLDLTEYAGQDVILTLRVDAAQAGAVGLWGNPVLRNNGAPPILPASDPKADAKRPRGVILIMAEALRRDRLSVYGYEEETSPALAQMASQGVLFTDCISQATTLDASAASIVSSLYVTSHTVHDSIDRLPSAAETLAEVYRKAGYATLSLSSASGTGQLSNLHQGFEILHESDSLRSENWPNSAGEYVDRLLPWLEEHKDIPFFVFLHVSGPKAANARNDYDNSVRAMDAAIGRLIKQLGTLGLADKTVVAFVGAYGSDIVDGDGGGSRGLGAYGALANVPLLITGPGGLSAGKVVDATVQTIDVMPTLLEMSGLELPDTVQGTGLLPLMVSSSSASEAGFGSSSVVTELSGGNCISADGVASSVAIIVDGWKLVENIGISGSPLEYELYNHGDDPLDQINVATEHPDLVERIKLELGGWRERALSVRLVSGAAAVSDVSSEELDQLEALGYL